MEIKQVRINGQFYELVTKPYVQESVKAGVDALRDELKVEYNTPYDLETNKVATMKDIENALYIDEEEWV
jgi:hypothetical protein